MSTYQEKQRALFDNLEQQFEDGSTKTTVVDPIQNYSHDKRTCLGYFYIPPISILQKISKEIIEPLKKVDPNQYYFPIESLHITIKNIRTSNYPSLYTDDTINKAKHVLEEIAPSLPQLTYDIKEIFELPSSIAIRCYADERLYEIVSKLDTALTGAGIPDNKQYASNEIFFGNITICRFQTKPSKEFYTLIESLKDISFGSTTVDAIRLLSCNTVCEPSSVTVHSEYKI